MRAYNTFLGQFPAHQETPNVMMKKGLALTDAGKTRKAIRAYNRLLARFPNDPQSGNVRNKRDRLKQ